MSLRKAKRKHYAKFYIISFLNSRWFVQKCADGGGILKSISDRKPSLGYT